MRLGSAAKLLNYSAGSTVPWFLSLPTSGESEQCFKPPFIPFWEHDYLCRLEMHFYCWKYHSFRTDKVQFTKSCLFCSSLVPLKCKWPAVPGSKLDAEGSWGECLRSRAAKRWRRERVSGGGELWPQTLETTFRETLPSTCSPVLSKEISSSWFGLPLGLQ